MEKQKHLLLAALAFSLLALASVPVWGDGAVEESGLYLLTMHPHIIGHRSRMVILDELIEYIRGHDGVWFATHEQVARYCAEAAGLGE